MCLCVDMIVDMYKCQFEYATSSAAQFLKPLSFNDGLGGSVDWINTSGQ